MSMSTTTTACPLGGKFDLDFSSQCVLNTHACPNARLPMLAYGVWNIHTPTGVLKMH
jgi:hypothetical protein